MLGCLADWMLGCVDAGFGYSDARMLGCLDARMRGCLAARIVFSPDAATFPNPGGGGSRILCVNRELSEKDSGNQRIRQRHKNPENLSAQLLKTKKLQHFFGG